MWGVANKFTTQTMKNKKALSFHNKQQDFVLP
jgi:hypothetical protein